jgi:hypothetical protein
MNTPSARARLIEVLVENADWMLSGQEIDFPTVEQFIRGGTIAHDDELIREVYFRLLALRTGELQQ